MKEVMALFGNKVECLKLLRGCSGLGLKEAKDRVWALHKRELHDTPENENIFNELKLHLEKSFEGKGSLLELFESALEVQEVFNLTQDELLATLSVLLEQETERRKRVVARPPMVEEQPPAEETNLPPIPITFEEALESYSKVDPWRKEEETNLQASTKMVDATSEIYFKSEPWE